MQMVKEPDITSDTRAPARTCLNSLRKLCFFHVTQRNKYIERKHLQLYIGQLIIGQRIRPRLYYALVHQHEVVCQVYAASAHHDAHCQDRIQV